MDAYQSLIHTFGEPPVAGPLNPGTLPLVGPGDPDPLPEPLAPNLRPEWNKFIDFLETKKLRGSPLLDDQSKTMGKELMAEYAKLNPGTPLTYEMVPSVQRSLQDYRAESLKAIKAGKAQFDGKEEEFMPGLSKVDGWLGSKTSSYRFPGAKTVVEKEIKGLTGEDSRNAKSTVVKNYGTDYEKYNSEMEH